MTANEMADYLESMADDVGHEGYHRYALVLKFEAPQLIRQQQAEIERLTMLCDCMTTESNRKGNEIEALKKQIPDWENINKPNPFIGWEKSLVAVDSNPNSGLGGIALKKASEK